MLNYVEVLPGFRIIPESQSYQVQGVSIDVIIHTTDGKSLNCHVENTLCLPDECIVLNSDVFNKRVVDALKGIGIEAKAVSWDVRYAIDDYREVT